MRSSNGYPTTMTIPFVITLFIIPVSVQGHHIDADFATIKYVFIIRFYHVKIDVSAMV